MFTKHLFGNKMNHKLRIINVLIFEALAIFIITPLFSFIFNKPLASIGFIAVLTSIIAMLINYIFNLFFYKWYTYPRYKLLVRTVLFQIVILSFFIPFVMFMLDFNFYQSVVYNTSGSLFFMTYFYVYNFSFEKVVNYIKTKKQS